MLAAERCYTKESYRYKECCTATTDIQLEEYNLYTSLLIYVYLASAKPMRLFPMSNSV